MHMAKERLRYPRNLLEEAWGEVPETLAALVDVVYFASQLREEGDVVRLAVAYHEGGAEGLASVRDRRMTMETVRPPWRGTLRPSKALR
jgi:hypothetical protein